MMTTQLNQQYDWLNEKIIMVLDMGHALLYISRVEYKSPQPAKFAGFSARFRQLLSLLHESKHSLNMLRRWTHNHLLFTKLRLLKSLKKTLYFWVVF